MIVLITGPSGAGKSTFVNRLMSTHPEIAFSVSTTTRPRRESEEDGQDYDFVDDHTFDRLIQENAFVEWATVHGNRYGTNRKHLSAMAAEGKVPLLDIDTQGAIQIQESFTGATFVFISPPSLYFQVLTIPLRLINARCRDTLAFGTLVMAARPVTRFSPSLRAQGCSSLLQQSARSVVRI